MQGNLYSIEEYNIIQMDFCDITLLIVVDVPLLNIQVYNCNVNHSKEIILHRAKLFSFPFISA
jgi:hypothetical protein